MSKQWFNEFLQSIFDRDHDRKGLWLTQKQTMVCKNYMTVNSVAIENAWGGYYNHDNYTYTWNGRSVMMSYSKKNGCGYITFGYTQDESAQMAAVHESEKQAIYAQKVERMRRHADRWMPKYHVLLDKLAEAKRMYEDDLANGADHDDIVDDLDDIEYYNDELRIYHDAFGKEEV